MILGELRLSTYKAVLREPDVRVTDVAKRYGVGRATIYKILPLSRAGQRVAAFSLHRVQRPTKARCEAG